jgi:hypothetical protein
MQVGVFAPATKWGSRHQDDDPAALESARARRDSVYGIHAAGGVLVEHLDLNAVVRVVALAGFVSAWWRLGVGFFARWN